MRRVNSVARRRIALLMALALLCAQAGALAHVYTHLHGHAASSDSLAERSRPCGDCQSLSPLLAAAGTPAHVLLIVRADAHASLPPLAAPRARAAPRLGFRSRAPPTAC